MKKDQGLDFRLADYLSSNIGNEGIEDFLNNGDGHAQVAYKGHIFLVDLNDYTFEYLGKSDGRSRRNRDRRFRLESIEYK